MKMKKYIVWKEFRDNDTGERYPGVSHVTAKTVRGAIRAARDHHPGYRIVAIDMLTDTGSTRTVMRNIPTAPRIPETT